MSAHFDKFMLNTYSGTPYFHAHVPEEYPLSLILQKCRAFRRLPPNLKELSRRAKVWATRAYPGGSRDIEKWYDAEGYELLPDTGRRLTDAEIDAEWDMLESRWGKLDAEVRDIPMPPGGFADPDTWQEPEEEPDLVDRDGLTEAQVLSDIASRGRTRTAEEYGVPASWLSRVESDEDLARMVLGMHDKPWPNTATQANQGTL